LLELPTDTQEGASWLKKKMRSGFAEVSVIAQQKSPPEHGCSADFPAD
jgi:hypothetical protein